MHKFSYDIKANSTLSRARTGTISTPHGDIQTPAFVAVGTKATLKSLAPSDLKKSKTQFMFANTYHLVLSPGVDVIVEHGGIHKMSGLNVPMITDSGGFQVFSLAKNSKTAFKDEKLKSEFGNGQEPYLVKIDENGVKFKSHTDGDEYYFTPEYSIQAQQKIGADFIVSFDECIYLGATKKYTKNATQRTHEWAERSINEAKTTCQDGPQRMFGVIQGGAFKDLRQWSTKTIAEMDFFGIGLGGVSVGETNEELREEITWMMDVLHTDPRPRHLLGISTFEDVLFGVKQGVDTFDCVLPTRDARSGKIYVRTGEDEHGIGTYEAVNILRSKWKTVVEPVHKETLGDVTFAYLHHLFKQKELLAYRLASLHNLALTEEFFAEIREAISDGRL